MPSDETRPAASHAMPSGRPAPHAVKRFAPITLSRRAVRTGAAILSASAFLAGCRGEQSTFAGAGVEAVAVEQLFWWMLGGAALVWIAVIGLSVYATVVHPGRHSEKGGIRLILWGGVAFPVVVLTGLLAFGLGLMPELRAQADGPRIAVSGERFWWRIHYDTAAEPGVQRSLPLDSGVESANELWLPVGRRTELMLGSPDVIHSFWVPAIAGKTDTIPGRINRLVLEPTRIGLYNGVCAEFCGTAHAQMGFRVRVVGQADYDAHVAAQAAPAAVLSHPGRDAFMRNGCAACHQVRGTEAAGRVGPDLTHVGSRETLGAGLLPMNAGSLRAFVADPAHEKPGVEMPAFAMIPADELDAIAGWLEALR